MDGSDAASLLFRSYGDLLRFLAGDISRRDMTWRLREAQAAAVLEADRGLVAGDRNRAAAWGRAPGVLESLAESIPDDMEGRR